MDRTELEALLDRVGDGDEAASTELLAYIEQQSPAMRELAYEALREGGADTREQLILTLAYDPSLDIRSAKRTSRLPGGADLGRAYPGGQPEQSVPLVEQEIARAPGELLVRLQSSNPTERLQAVRAAGEYEDPRLVPHLVSALSSGNRQLAGAAELTLRRLGSLAVPALIKVMQDKDKQARWHGAKVLSQIADQRSIPTLIDALEDDNYGTRWLAAEGLTRIGRPALKPLFQALADREKVGAWLRQGAYHVLNKVKLQQDESHYREVARQIRNASAGVVPTIATSELARLG